MNILFICHRLPFPPNRGGKIRPFNMIRHLHQKHTVVVASLAESEAELQAGEGLKEHCTEVIAEMVPKTVRWKQAVAALPTSTPSSAAYFWSAKLNRRIQQRVATARFDVVFVHCAFVANYAMHLPVKTRILDFGDLDSAKWAAYSQYRWFPLSVGYGVESWKLRKFEQKAARSFHFCTVTTQGEFEEFATLGVQTPAAVITNGVDTEYFCRDPQDRSPSSQIVFLGRMDYFPNIDGVIHFTTEVFPLVREQIPQATLCIVGSSPGRNVQMLARLPGVEVTGSVPDVRPYLNKAAVAIAPLRIARGTQNKVLECMAMGVPTVTTPEVAKGVQATPEQHLLVAVDPYSFARRVVEVIQNPKLRSDLATAGRFQIEAAHSWAQSMKALDAVLERACVIGKKYTDSDNDRKANAAMDL